MTELWQCYVCSKTGATYRLRLRDGQGKLLPSTSACGRSLVPLGMRGKSGHRRAGIPVKAGAREGNRA